jgi:hypothetical protein
LSSPLYVSAPAYAVYETRAALLADTPPYAIIGTELERDTVWIYVPDRGWAPISLVADHAGTPLVSTSDLGVPAFTPFAVSGNIILPNPPGTGPVGFHTVFSETIPAGYLGANGFVRFYMAGQVSNATGSTKTLLGRVYGDDGAAAVLGTFSAGRMIDGAVTLWEVRGILANANDVAAQTGTGSASCGRDGQVLDDATMFDLAGTLDTTVDFAFEFRISSGAGSPDITVETVVVETIYVD